MLRQLAILGVVLLVASSASAVPRTLRSKEDVRDLTDSTMRAVAENDIAGGMRVLAAHWPILPRDIGERIVEAEKQRLDLRRRFGLALRTDFLDTAEAGERLLRLTYLEQFQKGVLVWRFHFFRPEQIWLLRDVTRSEDFDPLFDN